MRIRLAIVVSVLVSTLTQLGGQSPKTFDVASVKRLDQPGSSTSSGGGPGTSDPGRWWRTNVTMGSLLVQAFAIQGHAIVGPEWLTSTRYEIVAKVPAGATRDDVPAMLQRLLMERFGLKFHREQKDMPGYALVTARSGPKLKTSTDSRAPIPGRNGFADIPEGIEPGRINVDSVGGVRRLAAGAMSMPEFADYLAAQNDFPVIDRTELRAKYEIVLYYSKPLQASENGFDLLTALREQLGLELQSRKVPVNLLVIDHIEQTPSAN
jgi:uncharacterized protein (TIGR03435 family)